MLLQVLALNLMEPIPHQRQVSPLPVQANQMQPVQVRHHLVQLHPLLQVLNLILLLPVHVHQARLLPAQVSQIKHYKFSYCW